MATQLTYKPKYLVLLLVFTTLGLATPGRAQDLFEVFGTGAETKVHAGAGILASRGPAANYYNPANLIYTQGFEVQAELDIVNVDYTYGYPGLEAITIKRTVTVPFVGMSWKPMSKLAVGFSLLPLPASSSSQTVDGLPTRKISTDPNDDPIIVDVEQKGKGLGYRLSLGSAYKVTSALTLGLSVLRFASGSTMTARDTTSGNEIFSEDTETATTTLVLGGRFNAFKRRLTAGLMLKLPSMTTTTGSSESPPLGDDAFVDTSGSSSGPLGLGFGVAYSLKGWKPYVELVHQRWSALRSQKNYSGVEEASVDYYDTTDIKAGIDYNWAVHGVTAALGIYQSRLGDGVMKAESVDDTEVIGLEYQDVDAMPYTVLAGGYRFRYSRGSLQAGLSYLNGTRSVWESARGYGDYKLTIITLILGGTYRF